MMILGVAAFSLGAAIFLFQEGTGVHFDFNISLGQIVIAATLIGGFLKFYEPLMQRAWEHDLMWEKFAAEHGISSTDRPKRKMWEKAKGASA